MITSFSINQVPPTLSSMLSCTYHCQLNINCFLFRLQTLLSWTNSASHCRKMVNTTIYSSKFEGTSHLILTSPFTRTFSCGKICLPHDFPFSQLLLKEFHTTPLGGKSWKCLAYILWVSSNGLVEKDKLYDGPSEGFCGAHLFVFWENGDV